MAVFFSSDHHFGHKNIIEYCSRPWRDTYEMDTAMIGRWNAIVQPDDTVFYLGDFSLSKQHMAAILPKLNGKKFLIAGNHDACHPAHHSSKKPEKHQAMGKFYLEAGWQAVFYQGMYRDWELCHFPYSDDMNREYLHKYRPKDEGKWLLHGHVHTHWRKKAKMINVGVDAWGYSPVSVAEIEALMADTREARW